MTILDLANWVCSIGASITSKLDYAKELLERSKMSIDEVAEVSLRQTPKQPMSQQIQDDRRHRLLGLLFVSAQ
jgi:hypothetical protein